MKNDLQDRLQRWKAERGITDDPDGEHTARFLLEQSLRMSYILFGMVTGYCIAVLATISYVRTSSFTNWAFVLTTVVMTWASRRGVTQIPKTLRIIRNRKTPETRNVVMLMMAVDILSLAVTATTLVRMVEHAIIASA